MRPCATADGVQFFMSSHSRIVTDAGESVDTGVPVDFAMIGEVPDEEMLAGFAEPVEDSEGNGPSALAALFDLEVISAAMNAFYAEKAANAA